MNTYNRLPVVFTHGEGSWLYDAHGRRYLDGLAGIAVSTLGHGHPRLTRALSEQVGRLIHTSNLYQVAEQEALSDRLSDISGMDEVFFCNSGCEANEAAIKLARLYGHHKGIDLPCVVVMEKSFHGRTLATLSATGNRKVQAGFEPLVGGFVRVPFNDLEAIRRVAETNPSVVAVLFEVIQGEGGINLVSPEFLKGLRQLCDEREWLMMCDEVQCGTGRTGRWFGYQSADVLPDVATLAKGLGSGVPIGACLAAGRATGVFKPGNHGSTFGGNPLACTAALTTLEVIQEDGLLQRARQLGETLREVLRSALDGTPGVVAVRGEGLMIGIQLDRPCAGLVERALHKGLLINVTAESVIRLLPPLVFTDADAERLVTELSPLVREFLAA
jgi:acetylornithine aminotransferase